MTHAEKLMIVRTAAKVEALEKQVKALTELNAMLMDKKRGRVSADDTARMAALHQELTYG